MKAKAKIMSICIASFFTLVISTVVIFDKIVISYVEAVEESKINYNYDMMASIFNREGEALGRVSLDWSNWDQTYKFMEGIDAQAYIDSNFPDGSTLKDLNLNFMFFINNQGKLIYSSTEGIDKTEGDFIINKITTKINGKYAVLNFKDNYEVKSGLLSLNKKIYILAVTDISSTDGEASSNGSLVIGRTVDSGLVSYISTLTHSRIDLLDSTNLSSMTLDKVIRDNDTALEYRKIQDITGSEEIGMGLTINRDEYNIALSNFAFCLMALISILLIIAGIAVTIADKWVIKRLAQVGNFIKKVSETKDTKALLTIGGNDEITEVANSINEMLKALDASYDETKTAKERYKLIMDSTNDGYVDYNFETREFYYSTEYARYFGCSKTKGILYESQRFNNLTLESNKMLENKFYSINWEKDFIEDEYEITKLSGEKAWIYQIYKVISRNENGKPTRIISILKDRTIQKNYEGNLLQLSYTDKLTGLKNRAFLEKKFAELDKDPESRYSVIIGDLNGLKLTNDTFGHQEGDRMIKEAAQVLQAACTEDEIVARWGGDEFVVLVENRDYEYTLNIIKKIKEESHKVTGFNYNMSIALGSARRVNSKFNSEFVMNMAEEKMYRSKLVEKSSSRNATITSLEKTLFEKNSETEEHTERIKILSKKLGQRLNLAPDKLAELELLSSLHDIGKIGIPEHILTKPGSLTKDEWVTMKKHTEIGYRIARATPELSHVAFEILCHHERYDGTGYPQGLKGESIPLLSRIINVVDSYDVMTHKRDYKEAFDKGHAVQELIRCSGTQFDPLLVDEFLTILDETPEGF